MRFWVGTTDPDWFRFLSIRRFDEVNFWQPSASARFETTDVGMPFLFKLKKPYNHIAGGGCFVGHSAIPVSLAWEIFGEKNGAASFMDLRQRLLSLKRGPADALHSIGCQIISNPLFLPKDGWLADHYRLDGQRLAVLPDDPRDQPDPDFLDWHMRNVFQY